MRARQGSGSTSPSEGGSPQHAQHTADSPSEPDATCLGGGGNGNNETSVELPPLETDTPWYRGLSPYKRRKLELQHRHTIIVAPNQEIMIDLWKKMAAKLPADVSAVTGETMGTGWSNKVAVSVCLCFEHNILASEQTRHAANPCQQDTDTLRYCLQLRIKGEAFKWIQDWMVNNGMFVGDEQYKQCALVVLGKGDLVDAKKN
ncbi:TPA: hypothetical protein ACH3X1_009023 [Trebouxia sp. C0004]